MSEQAQFYQSALTRFDAGKRTFHADLYKAGGVEYIQVGLEHVRAADDIRISYDFDRDGYKIEQSRWTDDDQTMTAWQEVAFIPAWGLDERANTNE